MRARCPQALRSMTQPTSATITTLMATVALTAKATSTAQKLLPRKGSMRPA